MSLIAELLPGLCLVCGQKLDAACGVCRACRSAIKPLSEPLCEICGAPLGRTGICLKCQSEPPAFATLRAAAVYGEPLSAVLAAFKYRRATVYKRFLAELLAGAMVDRDFDAVTFVPLHFTRQLSRGYNQAAVLARELARRQNLPYANLLVKTRRTSPQVGLRRSLRGRNLKSAFSARPAAKGMKILLVDDVITTGATMRAAALALKSAGAAEVHGLGVARALR